MLKILSGEFKGRVIASPPGRNTRPTLGRVRKAIFDALQGRLADAAVLDLFAGSGALGFEALSAGARSAVFVEQDLPTVKLIQKNGDTLKVADRIDILSQDIKKVAHHLENKGPFDVVFADPPYYQQWETWLLSSIPWEKVLAPGGLLSLEWSQKGAILPENIGFLAKIREKRYGDANVTFYTLRELHEGQSHLSGDL